MEEKRACAPRDRRWLQVVASFQVRGRGLRCVSPLSLIRVRSCLRFMRERTTSDFTDTALGCGGRELFEVIAGEGAGNGSLRYSGSGQGGRRTCLAFPTRRRRRSFPSGGRLPSFAESVSSSGIDWWRWWVSIAEDG